MDYMIESVFSVSPDTWSARVLMRDGTKYGIAELRYKDADADKLDKLIKRHLTELWAKRDEATKTDWVKAKRGVREDSKRGVRDVVDDVLDQGGDISEVLAMARREIAKDEDALARYQKLLDALLLGDDKQVRSVLALMLWMMVEP